VARQGERQWVVTLCCGDRPQLLDAFTRTLSKHVSKIVDADAMTTSDCMVRALPWPPLRPDPP
jgi:UTP:GlnB (protein PII) uridylyltransferase